MSVVESKISVISRHAFQHQNLTVRAFRRDGLPAVRAVPGGLR